MKSITNEHGIMHLGSLLIFSLVTAAIGYTAFRVFAATPQNQVQVENSSVQAPKAVDSDVNMLLEAETQRTPGTVTATFSQSNPASWPNGQTVAYVGINVDPTKVKSVKKVEWYLNNTKTGSLAHTQTSPRVGNLYQYDWPIKSLVSGPYRWIVKVYDTKGNYRLAQSAPRVPYVDMIVNNNVQGKVSGRFTQNHMTTWVPTQGTAYVGLNISQIDAASKVEWYLNNTSATSLKFTQTKAYAGTLYQYDWLLASYPAGTYRWFAKAYDKSGNYQLVTNNLGYPFVDMVVQK